MRGIVAWSTLLVLAMAYESKAMSLAIRAQGRTTTVPVLGSPTHPWEADVRDLRWELIGSLTVWFVWQTWCHRIFEGRRVPPAAGFGSFILFEDSTIAYKGPRTP